MREKVSTSSIVSASSVSSVTALQLSQDSDFIDMFIKSARLLVTKQAGAKFSELADDTLTYAECKTLYPKLGFQDSTSLVHCIRSINADAIKLSNKYTLTQMLINNAINDLNATTKSTTTPCQQTAIGNYIKDVAECAALGLIPIVGEVLCGTCCVGALVTYNGAMAACAQGGG